MNITQALVVLRALYHTSGHSIGLLSQQERAALLQLINFTDAELDAREEKARGLEKGDRATTSTHEDPQRGLPTSADLGAIAEEERVKRATAFSLAQEDHR